MSELPDSRGRASRACTAFQRRAWGRSILACALVLAVAAPAAARPLGQPHRLALVGRAPRVVFDDRDGRYLVSAVEVHHGGFVAVNLADVAAAGAPGERSFAPAGIHALADDLAYDSRRGRYLVAFPDSPGELGAEVLGVYGELRAGDGRVLAGPVRLTPAYGEPAVAYDPLHDQYLLVVTDSLAMSRVVAVRLGPDLRPLGAPIAVSDRPELVAQGQPAVVYRPQARDFVVSWLGERADGGADVFAERIGAAGGRLDRRSVNVTAGAGRVLSQSLAASAHGPEAAVAWEDQDGVRARRLGRSLRLGAVRAVSGPGNRPEPDLPGTFRHTAIAYQPQAREWLVTWAGTGPESPVDSSGHRVVGVFGQHLSAPSLRDRGPDDFPISETVEAPPGSFHAQSAPAVAADPATRDYLVAWSTDFTLNSGLLFVTVRRIAAEPPRR